MVLTSSLLTSVTNNTKTRITTLFTHGAVGDDNTTPTAGDTTLANEVFRDVVDETDTAAANKVIVSLRILTTEANGQTLREGGWFDDASVGTMYTRNTLTAINKTSDIQVYLDTSITIAVTEG